MYLDLEFGSSSYGPFERMDNAVSVIWVKDSLFGFCLFSTKLKHLLPTTIRGSAPTWSMVVTGVLLQVKRWSFRAETGQQNLAIIWFRQKRKHFFLDSDDTGCIYQLVFFQLQITEKTISNWLFRLVKRKKTSFRTEKKRIWSQFK